MHSKARGAARRDPTTRAYQEHIQASLDNTCPECRGTLHIWRNHYAEHRGRATLQQHVNCLHCNIAYARILPIPQPNPLWQALTGLAQLAFTSAKVHMRRAAQAARTLSR